MPWGLLAKGYRTRVKRKYSNRFILVRRDGRPMKQKPRRDGKGFFWSCETKYGSEWCKGRPRK
jgi:hypothetical protein